VVDWAIQAHGAAGVSQDFWLPRLMRTSARCASSMGRRGAPQRDREDRVGQACRTAVNRSDWLALLERAAQRAPAAAREPLRVGDAECGSVEPALGARMQSAGLPLRRDAGGWPWKVATPDSRRWRHGCIRKGSGTAGAMS